MGSAFNYCTTIFLVFSDMFVVLCSTPMVFSITSAVSDQTAQKRTWWMNWNYITIQLGFLPYFPYLFTIQLTFLTYISYLFTIQLTFLPYFPYLSTIQLTFLPYLPIFSLFNLLFFCIFQNFTLFNLLFFVSYSLTYTTHSMIFPT
jgi:hypothetical protein